MSSNSESMAENIKPSDLSKFDPLELTAKVCAWLSKEENGVYLGAGIDDNEQHTSIAVTFKAGGEDHSRIYYPLSEVRAAFPTLRSISEFIIEKKKSNTKYDFEPTELNEDELQDYEKSFGLEFNDELMADLIPFSKLIEYCMMYATDYDGGVSISLTDENLLEEMEDEESPLLHGTLVSIDFHYQNEKTGKGFGSYIYSLMDSIN